jgi:predicted GIY-YIG superfamily endonuclease
MGAIEPTGNGPVRHLVRHSLGEVGSLGEGGPVRHSLGEGGNPKTANGQRQRQRRCQRLFPDPQPLVEKLGRAFFRQLPESPGVYLMHDAADVVLYVGKAKNLRKRLNSYRVANSDRMARRHLRLLRAVVRIELQACADERAALLKEAELLRSLQPKFNRAGTWPAPPRFFAWRCCDDQIHLTVADAPSADWLVCGPLGRRASILRGAAARLLWVTTFPELGFTGLPIGWFHGVFAPEIMVPCGSLIGLAALKLEGLLNGQSAEFCDWVRAQMPAALNRFDQTALDAEFENLIEVMTLNRPADMKTAI